MNEETIKAYHKLRRKTAKIYSKEKLIKYWFESNASGYPDEQRLHWVWRSMLNEKTAEYVGIYTQLWRFITIVDDGFVVLNPKYEQVQKGDVVVYDKCKATVMKVDPTGLHVDLDWNDEYIQVKRTKITPVK